jgi:hypothetical protein
MRTSRNHTNPAHRAMRTFHFDSSRILCDDGVLVDQPNRIHRQRFGQYGFGPVRRMREYLLDMRDLAIRTRPWDQQALIRGMCHHAALCAWTFCLLKLVHQSLRTTCIFELTKQT